MVRIGLLWRWLEMDKKFKEEINSISKQRLQKYTWNIDDIKKIAEVEVLTEEQDAQVINPRA